MTTPLACMPHGTTTDHNTVQPRIHFLTDRMSAIARFATNKMPVNASILAGFLALAGLSGCAVDPFVDGRREAGSNRTVGRSTANTVAICYNSRSTTPVAVMQMAESECAKTDRVPRFDREDVLACSISNPTRAYFKCVSPAR